MASFVAKGIGRGLKNRGVASGLMWSEAQFIWKQSSKGEFSGFSITVFIVKMLCQSSWMCFSQFLPRRLGPFPLTTTIINFLPGCHTVLSHSVSSQPSYIQLCIFRVPYKKTVGFCLLFGYLWYDREGCPCINLHAKFLLIQS